MSTPNSSLSVKVDEESTPGQFFACCGLCESGSPAVAGRGGAVCPGLISRFGTRRSRH